MTRRAAIQFALLIGVIVAALVIVVALIVTPHSNANDSFNNSPVPTVTDSSQS